MLLQSSAITLLALLSSTATSQDKPVTVQPTAAPTLQQDFDAASEAAANGDCAAALPIFQRLEKNERVKPGSLPAATIAVGQGICLVKTGDEEGGLARIRAGLPVLAKAGDAFAADVARAEQTLGALAQRHWDHDEAVAHYKTALNLTRGRERISLLSALAMVTAFDGGRAPLAYLEDALTIEQAQPKPDRNVIAQLYDVHARILMNQGDVANARVELKKAFDLSGGVKAQISLADSAIRSDLARAALLAHDPGAAHEYLSYSGSGRIYEGAFPRGELMNTPQCGAETGLKPDDVAIAEFTVADDGSVQNLQIIYTRGSYATAAAFGRAVGDWHWDPAKLAKIPAFYRHMTRVEVRCSVGASGGQDVSAALRERVWQWAGKALALPNPGAMDARALRAAAAEHAARGDQTGALATNALLALSGWHADAEQLALADKVVAEAGSLGVPQNVQNAMRAFRLRLSEFSKLLRNRDRHTSPRGASRQRSALSRTNRP